MPDEDNSLWPETFANKSIPRPVEILKKQGDILTEITGGSVYGEVLQSSIPAAERAVYDLFVGVTGKSYRQRLLTIECDLTSGDATRMINSLAGDAVIQVHDEATFKENLGLILRSQATMDLVGRLWALSLDK